jgi:hypothetical protein
VSLTVVEKIKTHALRRVEKFVSSLTIREQQVYINEVVRYLDYLYDSVLDEQGKNRDYYNFIQFAFPVAFRYLYKNYDDVIGNPLIPSTEVSMEKVEGFLNICFKAGLMENIEELLRYDILTFTELGEKSVRLSYKRKYFSIERYEKNQSVKYSNAILRSLEEEYIKEIGKLPRVLKIMERLVFTWNKNFIGYDAHPEVDLFYIRNAQLDFIQAQTEWDGFQPNSKFGGVEYQYFLSALIAIESIALKHLQFVEVALKQYANLKKYNILPCVVDYQNILSTLAYILEAPIDVAELTLKTLMLNSENKESYFYINAPNPPFIKVSSTQLLRSYGGCIYRPIEFMLAELKRQYPKDWDRNTKEREQFFRDQLYSYFIPSERFIMINRSIDIYSNGKIITDIDACIVDKETCEIAFIQLKWQDSIYESTRSLVSKRKNYIEKTTQWVLDIQQWINNTDEKKIADYLQVSPRLINKKRIKLFVVGRHNGNYSGDDKPPQNATWCQWYKLIEVIEKCSVEGISIPHLFDMINDQSPYNRDNEYEPSNITYGNYSIELIAPPFNYS